MSKWCVDVNWLPKTTEKLFTKTWNQYNMHQWGQKTKWASLGKKWIGKAITETSESEKESLIH